MKVDDGVESLNSCGVEENVAKGKEPKRGLKDANQSTWSEKRLFSIFPKKEILLSCE